VANLAPISETTFLEKSRQVAQDCEKFKSSHQEIFCSHCHKKFQSSKALENHFNSKKHKENILKSDNNVIEKQKPMEYEGISIGDCLFCSSSLSDFDSCLKIGAGKTCIRCNSYRFRDLDAVQKHMRDKNHCNFRIDDTELVEFVDFYDYSIEGNDDMSTLVNVMKEVFESCSADDDASFITIPTGLLAVKLAKNTKRITNRVVQKYQLKKGLANNRIFVSAGRKDQM
uniref:C2H2-type domain-containing protein n=1 Tax=Meloidogyne javanica TaxID=6303 RepID=A0A915LUD9_MELJA